jgi:hypothetical protein
MSSVRDIMIIAIMLFAFGLLTVFVVNISHRVNTNLLAIPVMNDSTDAVNLIEHADAAQNMMDYIYLACFLGFFISIIIFGWLVGGTPILAPVYFFIVVIFTFVSVILQLVWQEIVSNASLITTMSLLPITNFIVGHLGMFMAVFGLVGIVVMFAKPQDQSGSY